MARFTLKRSLREASCWSVDVIKDGTGFRRFSRVATELDEVFGRIEPVDQRLSGRSHPVSRPLPHCAG